jgi:hypothetical protein
MKVSVGKTILEIGLSRVCRIMSEMGVYLGSSEKNL